MNAMLLVWPRAVSLTREDLEEIAEVTNARLNKRLYGSAKHLTPGEPCAACDGQQRQLSWADGIIRPCSRCRPAEFARHCAERAAWEEAHSKDSGYVAGAGDAGIHHAGSGGPENPALSTCVSQNPACPIAWDTSQTGTDDEPPDGIERRDPWDVGDEPITLTSQEMADAERRNCKGYVGKLRDDDTGWGER
jgi:hypothetical protein